MAAQPTAPVLLFPLPAEVVATLLEMASLSSFEPRASETPEEWVERNFDLANALKHLTDIDTRYAQNGDEEHSEEHNALVNQKMFGLNPEAVVWLMNEVSRLQAQLQALQPAPEPTPESALADDVAPAKSRRARKTSRK